MYSKETKSVMAVWQLNSSIGGFHRLSERPFCEHFYHMPLGVCHKRPSIIYKIHDCLNINDKCQISESVNDYLFCLPYITQGGGMAESNLHKKLNSHVP